MIGYVAEALTRFTNTPASHRIIPNNTSSQIMERRPSVLVPTMLTALGSIADQQANPTEKKMQKVKQLLDYAASHPDAVLTYQASEMVVS